MRKTTFRMAVNVWVLGLIALAAKAFVTGFTSTSLFVLFLVAGVILFYILMNRSSGISTPIKPEVKDYPTQQDVSKYILYMKEKFPGFKVKLKSDSLLMKVFGKLMFWQKSFMTRYNTVIPMLRRLYVTDNFFKADHAMSSLTTLRHEEVHLEDSVNFFPFFSVSYILLLPIGPSFRGLWELRAYKESITAQIDYGRTGLSDYITHVASLFAGPMYLYMFPFPSFIRKRLRKHYTEQMNDVLRQNEK